MPSRYPVRTTARPLTATALLLAGCAQGPTPGPAAALAPPLIGLANPASVFCLQQGGQLRPVQTPQGASQLCVLPNGQAIDAWDFFRQHQTPLPTR